MEINCLLFEFLGMSVVVNVLGMLLVDKCEVYKVDIIYLINSELGFDYLCDNFVYDKNECF